MGGNGEIEDLLGDLDSFADRLDSLVLTHGVGAMLVIWYRHRVARLRRAVERQSANRPPSSRGAKLDFADLVGESPALVAVRDAIARLAATDATVLIEGETGTGKELIARKLHALSPRAPGKFVVVDATEPRFEIPSGGTIYFGEVSELSLEAQAEVLRLLDSDARVIAATTRDLAAEVAAGRLRSDLLARLEVTRLRVPPLPERQGDVALLAMHFMTQYCEEHARSLRRIRPDALAALEVFPWPGNVGELASTIERGVILSSDQDTELALDRLGLDAMDDGLADAADMRSAMRAYKRRLVERALESSKGSNIEAAKLLGVHPKYFYQLLRELDLPPSSARGAPPSSRHRR